MQSVEDFMRNYLSERRELRRAWLKHSEAFRNRFFTPEYSARHQKQEEEKDHSATIVQVNESCDSTNVITIEPCGKRQ